MLFPRFRHLLPNAEEGTSGERAFRLVLLVCVFALAGWGFWTNMERRMERLGAAGNIRAEDGTFSQAERKDLEERVKRFEKRFDLTLEIRAITGPFRPESWNGKSVLLAVGPQTRQVVFTAPPLVRRALGEEFMAELVDSFAPAFTQGDAAPWKDALFGALNTLERKLAELTR